MKSRKDVFLRCRRDPQWESEHVSKRPLRGFQAEIVQRLEEHVMRHEGGVATVLCSRQVGKNDMAAVLQRRHLWRRQKSPYMSTWIRTAPTHKPQIVNSKKRLEQILRLDRKSIIRHPLFLGAKLQKKEGYIWQLGNASVEFLSSGKQSNVVGATASECLDMDEAHKVNKDKFDEDFAPFTADQNAATILWGVAADGLDTIEWYRKNNKENGRDDLNLYYPCEVWMEFREEYRLHVEDRVNKLGWDHPIIKTQYRLLPVAAEGAFLNQKQIRSILSGQHKRLKAPIPGRQYEMLIDVAAGNEEFNPENMLEGEEETKTDSTIVWIYEVTDEIAQNNLFPILNIVDLNWFTGADLPSQEEEIKELIAFWRVSKVTIDGVGVGRQIAEAMENEFGTSVVFKYIATETSVSEDCFDLLARANYAAVRMFQNDGSREYEEFVRQLQWTRYASNKGRMKLVKPKADQHIDMTKGLTYINRNSPVAGMQELYTVEGE